MNKILSQYSQDMAARILEMYPQWKDIAGTDEHNGETYFNLEITPPSTNAKDPLRVYTYKDEITVSFDAYHGHFQDLENQEGNDAKTLIDQIISDKYAVVSYWHNNDWCGSMLLGIDNWPKDNKEHPHANRIEIRTWTGKSDKDVKCKSAD